MGNKSSSPSSQLPPYLLGSGSGSKSIPKRGTHYYTAPFIAQPYGAPAFHQSVNSLLHFSGTDSGYMTSPANSEQWRTNNWKIGNSCLSLNEAFFVDGPPGAPSTVLPMPPVISIPPPTLKQFKKWQKRQKKVLKKMSSIPANIIPPHASVIPLLRYSRAFSVDNLSRQVVDGYVNVPVTQKRNRNQCGKVARNQTYNEAASDMPPGPLKSSFSSSCSNGLAISDLRIIHSAPSTNTSDRSHLTSTTDHSSSLHHQILSPVQLKNSSNQHFQRIRLSQNDAGLAGTPRRLQQRNFVVKGGPTAIVQHEAAGMIDEITSSEVRKSEIGPYSANINYESRKIATNSDCSHSKTATSYDCDKRNYGYRNDNSDSNRNSQYSDCIANNNGDISMERNRPVKVILEAEEIPEKNIQLFSKNITDPTDDKIFSTDEKTSNPSQQYNSTPGTAIQSQTTQQTQSADYGSTISSLTQSSNMKTEVSDIDFSWVNDVENRLEREIAFVREDSGHQLQRKQLPMQYFGMDLNQSKTDKEEATIVTSPIYTAIKSLEVFGECESRKELSQIQSDVRSKAAMFDIEAFRKVDEQQAAYRYRSRSTPRSNVYISQPDYRNYDLISIDNSQQSGQYGNIHSNDVSVSIGSKFDRCPQRYSQGSSNLKLSGNVTEVETKCGDSYPKNNNSEKIIKQQQQQQPYSDYGDEITQRNRTSNETEYCIQNAFQRNTEKPWKISVAY